MSSLGSRIKGLRKENNISQKEFAAKMGVSNVVLSRYESDERKPDYDVLQQIADYFEVTLDYLLGRTDEPANDEEAFQAFINDPELGIWYRDLPKSSEEELQKLRAIWDVIKNEREK